MTVNKSKSDMDLNLQLQENKTMGMELIWSIDKQARNQEFFMVGEFSCN